MRLDFGNTPTPEEYTTTSESEIELGNDLLKGASWDTANQKSPHIHLLPREDYLPPSETLLRAYQLELDIEAKEDSMYGFIDDIITITIDDPILVERSKNASLLIIHTLFRTLQSSEPLKRDDPLSLKNLSGECQPA